VGADDFDNWTVQLRKGFLELCVLAALAGRERYGFELVKSLAAIPGLGVSVGTLYPLLSRLRVQGLVRTRLEESSAGPARKYYALTPGGRRTLAAMRAHLASLVTGLERLPEGEETA
jgi:PadR family transcriptional regulator PadR